MDQILALEIAFRFGEAEGVIYPVVLMDGQDTILVDCGYVGFLPKLEAALQGKGIEAGALTKVLITHHDHDHMGALYDLKGKYPQIEVVASGAEAPYVSGAKKSLRLEQAEAMQAALPEEQKEFGRSFIELLRYDASRYICYHGGLYTR